jgi:hypothetical protein
MFASYKNVNNTKNDTARCDGDMFAIYMPQHGKGFPAGKYSLSPSEIIDNSYFMNKIQRLVFSLKKQEKWQIRYDNVIYERVKK